MESDGKFFNVHLVWPDQQYDKMCVTALSKNDALLDSSVLRARDAGAYPFKVIPLSAKPATPKQKLAQRYGFLMGSLKGAKVSFIQCYPDLQANAKEYQVTRAIALVNAQLSKLERDLRDCFKLAGLKIK